MEYGLEYGVNCVLNNNKITTRYLSTEVLNNNKITTRYLSISRLKYYQIKDFNGFSAIIARNVFHKFHIMQTSEGNRLIPFDFNSRLSQYTPLIFHEIFLTFRANCPPVYIDFIFFGRSNDFNAFYLGFKSFEPGHDLTSFECSLKLLIFILCIY